MRRLAFFAALLTFLSPSVSSAGPAAISVRDAIGLAAALRSLDGHTVVVQEAGKDIAKTMSYEFGSGTLRLRIASDLRILAGVEKQLEDARRGVVREILQSSGRALIDPGTPAYEDFTKQMEAILEQPASGADGLARIKASELKLDKNEIPATTLAAMAPVLDQDQ